MIKGGKTVREAGAIQKFQVHRRGRGFDEKRESEFEESVGVWKSSGHLVAREPLWQLHDGGG